MHTTARLNPRSPEELLPAQWSELQTLLQAVFLPLRDMLEGDLIPLVGICNLSFI